METRPAYFRSTLHLFRRRHGASRFARCRKEKTRRPVQSQKIQRPGNLLRQSAREIRAGIDGTVGRFCETPIQWRRLTRMPFIAKFTSFSIPTFPLFHESL